MFSKRTICRKSEGVIKIKYYYFVSFQCENEYGSATGNITFESNEKIRTGEAIKSIQNYVEKNKNVRKVTLTNIVLLDSE
ncbi:hypothetical protein [Clostridium sp.]|uniref:hypothetical protein n=1 Tax=Clostridium sp. TaxID=1506 RepID=UPI003216D96F